MDDGVAPSFSISYAGRSFLRFDRFSGLAGWRKAGCSGMKVAQSIRHFIKPVNGHTIEVPGASHAAIHETLSSLAPRVNQFNLTGCRRLVGVVPLCP
jgi:hypothetical protein